MTGIATDFSSAGVGCFWKRACRSWGHEGMDGHAEPRSDALRHMIERMPRWVRTDLSSADAGLRERAEDALLAMLLGVDIAIDYKNERFEDVVCDVDMVFDPIAGETQERSFQVLREGGIMVSTLQEHDQAKAARHKIRTGPRYTAQPKAGQFKEVAGLIDAGKVKVIVSETFPLEQVKEAQERLADGGIRGKIVLTVD